MKILHYLPQEVSLVQVAAGGPQPNPHSGQMNHCFTNAQWLLAICRLMLERNGQVPTMSTTTSRKTLGNQGQDTMAQKVTAGGMTLPLTGSPPNGQTGGMGRFLTSPSKKEIQSQEPLSGAWTAGGWHWTTTQKLLGESGFFSWKGLLLCRKRCWHHRDALWKCFCNCGLKSEDKLLMSLCSAERYTSWIYRSMVLSWSSGSYVS